LGARGRPLRPSPARLANAKGHPTPIAASGCAQHHRKASGAGNVRESERPYPAFGLGRTFKATGAGLWCRVVWRLARKPRAGAEPTTIDAPARPGAAQIVLGDCRRRSRSHCRAGRTLRAAWPQRRRQDHHAAHDRGPVGARRRKLRHFRHRRAGRSRCRHAQSKVMALIEHLMAMLWAIATVLALVGSA